MTEQSYVKGVIVREGQLLPVAALRIVEVVSGEEAIFVEVLDISLSSSYVLEPPFEECKHCRAVPAVYQ